MTDETPADRANDLHEEPQPDPAGSFDPGPAAEPESQPDPSSDSEPKPAGEPESEATPTPGEAWDDVVLNIGRLGDALAAWAKSATDSPENRRHLDEVRSGINDIARQANDAFNQMAGGDFGKQVSEGASNVGQAMGDTAHELGSAAAPHVANALAGLADVFGKAAQYAGEQATKRTAAEPVSTRPAPEPPTSIAVPMPASGDSEAAGDETGEQQPTAPDQNE